LLPRGARPDLMSHRRHKTFATMKADLVQDLQIWERGRSVEYQTAFGKVRQEDGVGGRYFHSYLHYFRNDGRCLSNCHRRAQSRAANKVRKYLERRLTIY